MVARGAAAARGRGRVARGREQVSGVVKLRARAGSLYLAGANSRRGSMVALCMWLWIFRLLFPSYHKFIYQYTLKSTTKTLWGAHCLLNLYQQKQKMYVLKSNTS